MNFLRAKMQGAPPLVQVLVAGAFTFALFAALRYVPPLVATGQMDAGLWEVVEDNGPFALGMMALTSAGLLMEKRPAWRRPLLAVGMAGCVLMLMGYSFVLGYVVSQAGWSPMSLWNWFTIVFIFLVPVAAFVQGFRAYTRPPESASA